MYAPHHGSKWYDVISRGASIFVQEYFQNQLKEWTGRALRHSIESLTRVTLVCQPPLACMSQIKTLQVQRVQRIVLHQLTVQVDRRLMALQKRMARGVAVSPCIWIYQEQLNLVSWYDNTSIDKMCTCPC